jgi:hypothetical protein
LSTTAMPITPPDFLACGRQTLRGFADTQNPPAAAGGFVRFSKEGGA